MKNIFNLTSFLFLILFSSVYYSQQAAMEFLGYPRSISSMSMGQNSVALHKSDGALVYNPANLIYTEQPVISFYHRQFAIMKMQLPVNSVSVYKNFEGIGYFGIEYLNRSMGEFIITGPEGPAAIDKYSAYERSFSIGYARSFSDEFAAGAQLTYATSNIGRVTNNHFFVSAGLNYTPNALDKKFTLGFSLTNFSTAIKYEYKPVVGPKSSSLDPSPSALNLGIYYSPFENDYFSLGMQAAISKYLVKQERGYIGDSSFVKDPESSFSALFSDWEDFPDDVDLHFGLAYEWKPLDLGKGFSFLQEYYIGDHSSGIKHTSSGFFTHGANYGLEYRGIRFTAGYTGIWHLVHNTNFVSGFLFFPMESFQFTLGLNESVFSGKLNNVEPTAGLKNIVISLGVGQTIRLGRYKETNNPFYSVKQPDNLNYNVEAAFYFNDRNSLVSTFTYNPYQLKVYFQSNEVYHIKYETIFLGSHYRYHPLEFFKPLFVQGGLGIIRYKPNVDHANPRYEYKSTIHFAVGAALRYLEPIIIAPEVAFTSILNTSGNSAPRIGGFNQFDLNIKVGYKL